MDQHTSVDVTDVRIKRLLPRTWTAFFSRWGRLTEIQRMAIPFILRNYSLLLHAPTASGKTEAVLAPVIEQALKEQWPLGSILYVTPTRALVNDIHRRMQPVLSSLGLTTGRRTGDFHEATAKNWPHLLILTPESLDSLLCRFPAELTRAHCLILDELHLVDGTLRGDQLRLLVQRLNRIVMTRDRDIYRYGLSATISDPENMGLRYLGSEFRILRSTYRRVAEIIGLFPSEADEKIACTVADVIRRHGFHKILLFTNAKIHAEKIAVLLQQTWGYPERVFVHHGRLSRRVRLDVEHAFRSAPVGICIATTTLEVGVDIGGIDAIGLLAVPHSFESFQQRLGRGRRKEHVIPVFAFYRDDLQKVLLETFFDLINGDIMPEQPYEPLPAAAVQQTLSYILQKRRVGTSQAALQQLWSDVCLHPHDILESVLEQTLDRWADSSWIRRHHTLYYPGDKLDQAFQLGWIHSTIEDQPGLIQVVDENHRKLAELVLDSSMAPGERLQIGGRTYRVLRMRNKILYVQSVADTKQSAVAPFPMAPAMHWNYSVGNLILQRLYPDLPPSTIPVFQQGRQWTVIHGFGHHTGLIWSRAMESQCGWRVKAQDALLTTFNSDERWPDSWLPQAATVEAVVSHSIAALEHGLGTGRFYRMLPPTGRLLHILRAIRWDSFYEYLQTLTFVIVQPDP